MDAGDPGPKSAVWGWKPRRPGCESSKWLPGGGTRVRSVSPGMSVPTGQGQGRSKRASDSSSRLRFSILYFRLLRIHAEEFDGLSGGNRLLAFPEESGHSPLFA